MGWHGFAGVAKQAFVKPVNKTSSALATLGAPADIAKAIKLSEKNLINPGIVIRISGSFQVRGGQSQALKKVLIFEQRYEAMTNSSCRVSFFTAVPIVCKSPESGSGTSVELYV